MRFYRYYCIFKFNLCLAHFVTEDFPAFTAGPVLDVAGLCAGRGLRLCLDQIVNMLQLAERNFVLIVISQRILVI